MQLLSISILWLLITYIFVTVHYYIITRRKKTPNHGLSFAICLALAVWISITVYDSVCFVLVSILYLGLMYWVGFNLLLNLFRDYELTYLGSASWFDRLEKRAKSPFAMIGIKIVLMIACVFILLDLPNPWA